MNDAQLLRYSRHILLDEMGIEAQERLLAATVLVIGVGGLGCPAALYLASSGIGRIVLVDDDTVDLTNLQRQVLHREDRIGALKVDSGRDALRAIQPECEVQVISHRLEGAALLAAVRTATVVLDCSDNFASRHAVNRACVEAGVPLVSGAALRFDGQLAVFDTRHATSPCYHCLFPEGEDVEEVRCATMGVFAPLTGIVGTLQAAEALKIAGGFGRPAWGRLLLIDARSLDIDTVRVPRDGDCPVCRERPAHPSA